MMSTAQVSTEGCAVRSMGHAAAWGQAADGGPVDTGGLSCHDDFGSLLLPRAISGSEALLQLEC